MGKNKELEFGHYNKIIEKLNGIEKKVDALHAITAFDVNSPEFKKAVEAVLRSYEERNQERFTCNGIGMEALIERDWEIKNNKVKTGDRRLDDLLLGGIPNGSNVAVYGPVFTGKEITVNRFIADGLKKGIPAVCVLTNHLVSEFKNSLNYVLSDLEEYENRGLLHYVDAYSRSIGCEENHKNSVILDEFRKTEDICNAINDIAFEQATHNHTYRLAFMGLSDIMCAWGLKESCGLVEKIAAQTKKDNAVSLYTLEKGMHDELEINNVLKLMDGAIDYKVEQLRTYLCIKGICDVQSRAWVDYTYSKQGLNIGSFCLSDIE